MLPSFGEWPRMTKSTERHNYRSSKWLLAICVAMYLRAGQNLAIFPPLITGQA